jgi:uncharacterized membrane protein (DUF106 family)
VIANRQELEVTQKRIDYFQHLLEEIREKATPEQFESMAGGYRLEIERMQAEVMDYLLRPVTSGGQKQPA